MTNIEIGSKWKYKNSNDVYVVMEQYFHRVVLKHELTGTIYTLMNGGRQVPCPDCVKSIIGILQND